MPRQPPLVSTLLVVVALAGCAKTEHASPDLSGPPPPPTSASPASNTSTESSSSLAVPAGQALAYTHLVEMVTEGENVAGVATTVQSTCEKAGADCVLSSLEVLKGEWPGASIQIKATRAVVSSLRKVLADSGKLVTDTTGVENIAPRIADIAKRLEMAIAYRKQLEELRNFQAKDLQSAQQYMAELASVQVDIETLSNAAAENRQRIDLEVMHINISSLTDRAASWMPVHKAFSRFFETLSEATGAAISFVAAILPFGVLASLGWLMFRRIRRSLKTRRENEATPKN